MSTESIDPTAPGLPPLPPADSTEHLLGVVGMAGAILRERGIDYRTGQPIATYTPGADDSNTIDHATDQEVAP